MNDLENKMLAALKRLKSEFGCLGVKAEFEAEGTRLEELLRLVDITRRADVKLGIKIGGCEAIKDILDAKQIGVDYLIAPMIESGYALEKYDQSLKRVYFDESSPSSLFNIETAQGFSCANDLICLAKESNQISGVVFGRVDYSLSKGMKRDDINSEEILNDCLEVSRLCKKNDLDFVVGGGVSSYALDFLREIKSIKLDRFETRKIIFSSDSLNQPDISEGLLLAVKFELLWLMNKRNYYLNIGKEDAERIDMLESRWNVLDN